ncbi:MAG: hypothetical protein JJT75_14210 [Opitutales bacterium]|nr:hypothetical protein [Opitutales bacterium]MCH8539928.1 hypothetical protein [Opitutales bacterium]
MKALRLSLISLGVLGLLILGLCSLVLLPPVQKALFVRYLEADGIMKAEVDGFRVGWRTITVDNLRLERRNDRYGTDKATFSISLFNLLRGKGLFLEEAHLGNVYFIYHERDPDEKDRPKRERPFQGIVEELREVQRMETPDDEPSFLLSAGHITGNLEWAYHPLEGPSQEGKATLSLKNYHPGETAELHFDGWYQSELLPFASGKTPFSGIFSAKLSTQGIWDQANLDGEIQIRPRTVTEAPLPIEVKASWGPNQEGEVTHITLQAAHENQSALSLEHQLQWHAQNLEWQGMGRFLIEPALLDYLQTPVPVEKRIGELTLAWSSDEAWKVLTAQLKTEIKSDSLMALSGISADWPAFLSTAEIDLALDFERKEWQLNTAKLDLTESVSDKKLVSLVTPYPLRGTLDDPWSSVEFQEAGSGPFARLSIKDLPLEPLARMLPPLPATLTQGFLASEAQWDGEGWLVENLTLAELALHAAPVQNQTKRTAEEISPRSTETEAPSTESPFQGILAEITWPDWLRVNHWEATGRYLHGAPEEEPLAVDFSLGGDKLARGNTSPFLVTLVIQEKPLNLWKVRVDGHSEILANGSWRHVGAEAQISPPENSLPDSLVKASLTRTSSGERYRLSWAGLNPPFAEDRLELSGLWESDDAAVVTFNLQGNLGLPPELVPWPWFPEGGTLSPSGKIQWNLSSGESQGDLGATLSFRDAQAFSAGGNAETDPKLSLAAPFHWDGTTLRFPEPSLILGGKKPILALSSTRTLAWSDEQGWSGGQDRQEEALATLQASGISLDLVNPFLEESPWRLTNGVLDGEAHLFHSEEGWAIQLPSDIIIADTVLTKEDAPFLTFDRTLIKWDELLFSEKHLRLEGLRMEGRHDEKSQVLVTFEGTSTNPRKGQGSFLAEGVLNLPELLRQPGLESYRNTRAGTVEWRARVHHEEELSGEARIELKDPQLQSSHRRLPNLLAEITLEPSLDKEDFLVAQIPITLGSGEPAETVTTTLEVSRHQPLRDFIAQTKADTITVPRWLELQELFEAPPESVLTGPSGRPLEGTRPAPSGKDSHETTEGSSRTPTDQPFWGELRGQWTLAIEKLRLEEPWQIDKFRHTAHLDDQEVKQTARFHIAEGRWEGSSILNREQPGENLYSWQSSLRFSDFQPAPFLNPGNPSQAVLTGTFSGEAKLGSKGKPLDKVFSDWEGTLALSGKSGRIRALSADERTGRYAGLAGDIAGLLGDIGRRPELSAISELTRFFSDFPYAQLEMRIERDQSLDTSLPVFRLQSPDFLLAGAGIMPHREDLDYLDQPFRGDLQLGARRDLAKWMQTLRLIEAEPRESGYRFMTRTIPLRGTPRNPDLQALTDFVIQTGLEATGLRRRSTEDDRQSSPSRQDDLRNLFEGIFR